ncbi:hypothetical protein [Pseudomonas sp. NPDC090208]|uniref:hypothetical protein n=1 Tax=Pseudomonas sp. NPDC090208 TaxID=3364478 RepID=UPI003802A1B2
MKSIQPVHTRRVSVQPRELTIGQVRDLCAIPYRYEQRTITTFLRHCCEQIPRPAGQPAVTDPLFWSVNERMNVTVYYLAAVLDDGPNFEIGNGHLSDYLLAGTDYVEAAAFEFQGKPCICTPLHGYQAEAIETLVESGRLPKTYASWQFGVMAACVRDEDEEPLAYSTPVAYAEALLARIEKLMGVPESDFIDLFDCYSDASMALQHHVHAVFNHQGVLAAQVSEPDAEKGVPELGYARFHPRRGISRRACELVEADDEQAG